MRLSAERTNPDYHDVVHFVDKITVDNLIIDQCLAVDVANGVVWVFTKPMKPDKDGNLACHAIRGKVDILWRPMKSSYNGLIDPNRLFLHLKADWEQREQSRMGQMA